MLGRAGCTHVCPEDPRCFVRPGDTMAQHTHFTLAVCITTERRTAADQFPPINHLIPGPSVALTKKGPRWPLLLCPTLPPFTAVPCPE